MLSLPSADPFLIVPIARWHLCEPGVAPLDLTFIEPMLRRRLSAFSRMSLCAAHACAREVSGARIVFASRHGDLARTTALIEKLAEGEELSPALFSLSVLNASAGLFSMLQKNTAPATAISAGRASFAYGLLEACAQQLEHPGQPVLYVYADEPVPAVYGEAAPPGSEAHALALLLSAPANWRLSCSLGAGGASSGLEASRAFLRCLDEGEGGGEVDWSEAGQRWRWRVER